MGININFSSRDTQYINFFWLFNSKEGGTITMPPLILSGYVPACFLNSPPPPTHTPFKYGNIILKQIKFPKLY